MIQVQDGRLRRARYLAVAFTGVSHGLGGIRFEFRQSLEKLDCASLFVADIGQRWYQYGPLTIAALADRLKAAIATVKAERVTFLGNSMGGFGALYFGALCRADAILSFCPQTAIDPSVTAALGDKRWRAYQRAIPIFPFGDLAEQPPAVGEVTCCVGADQALDRAHVDRLQSAWTLRQILVEGAGHDAAAKLKDRGELVPLIEDAMTGRGWAGPA